MAAEKLTPWQWVHQKFAISPAALSRHLGRHRSKLSRALADPDGLISGRDQVLLMAVAKALDVELTPADLTPRS